MSTTTDKVTIREDLINLRLDLLKSFTDKINDGDEDINAVFVLLTDKADKKVQFHYPRYSADIEYDAALKQLNRVMEQEEALGCVFVQHGEWQGENDEHASMCLFMSCIMPGWKNTVALLYTEDRQVGNMVILEPEESKEILSGLTALDLN